MMKQFLILNFFITFFNCAYAISDFSTDGCSAYPDGITGLDSNRWMHCCFTHDIAYWVGGSKSEKIEADKQLRFCVAENSSDSHGRLMELGVSVGGIPGSALPWRWGYGFDDNRDYKEMTSEEAKEAFEKYDRILDVIESYRHELNDRQISYMIARYENSRHDLQLRLNDKNVSGSKSYDERYQQILRIYNK